MHARSFVASAVGVMIALFIAPCAATTTTTTTTSTDASLLEPSSPSHDTVRTTTGPPNNRARQHLDQTRRERFPNRVERVKLYMSNWYVPPCRNGTSESMDGVALYKYVHHQSDTHQTWTAVHVTEASNVVVLPSPEADATGNVTGGSSSSGSNVAPRTFAIESIVTPDKTMVLDRATILECARSVSDDQTEDVAYKDRILFRTNMRMYCADVAQSVLPALDHVTWEQTTSSSTTTPNTERPRRIDSRASRKRQRQRQRQRQLETMPATSESVASIVVPPMLLQFGDLAHSHVFRYVRLPHLKKFRLAANRSEVERITRQECHRGPRLPLNYDPSMDTAVLQPIVWKLATHRHYGLLDLVAQDDIPWGEKKDMAVFRGQLTGSLGGGYNKHVSPEQNCFNLMRCRLVYNHANSTFVDARLTSTRKRLPNVLNGVELTTPSKPVQSLLAFKGIVMLEGNDVASGLKWALLSQSVVLMPIPRHTSWAMEELLIPWVHFVPLHDDASNVEAQMRWVVEHDTEAQEIAYASTLWMQDLVYHPDAAEDDRWIQEEIVRRYQRHFVAVR